MSNELEILLDRLIAGWEKEVVEFKNVGDSYSTSDIGKYFSALANEANLRRRERAWLVFGVENCARRVVGSDYRAERPRLDGLKHQIAQGAEPSITFREIHELALPAGRVIMFEIPASPVGIPIAWQGHYYARAGESLTPLGLDKLDEIRQQSRQSDWSAVIVPQARLDHLDEEALALAKKNFIQKHANRFAAEQVQGWGDQVFLDRCKLSLDGQLTRAAILLLGKDEASPLLSPNPAELTWKLEGQEKAYEHFHTPFLLNTSRLFQRIRNVQMRILPDDSLIPVEISKYERRIVMEAIHNGIAHQDYAKNARIIVTEFPDRLVLQSVGDFFEGAPGDYITGQRTPTRYRNPLLVQAMAALNMIDTMGSGIHEMHIGQARRYFPLPDYDLIEPESVRITIYGKVLDLAYSRLLIEKTDLPLEDVLALDRIQKKLAVDDPTVRRLRRSGLVEGRKPNLHVSASVASATATKADYIQTRSQDDAFYSKLVLDYLTEFESASRKDIDELLWNKLSKALSDQQKANRVRNLLNRMRESGEIENAGTRKLPNWVLKRGGDGESK